ncbi:hypothetical protein [Macrococcoides caseolyticum]|uniref:hypothetical protein n=1 Tax=Macrococcoides caseolyticum TaxID=69966 RepID=UPI001F2DF4B7|nr:hypothetical protein [Macrococcus caseolyticus]MCE4957414.1 hypothetical protein [Macrococcus caseolyticus]
MKRISHEYILSEALDRLSEEETKEFTQRIQLITESGLDEAIKERMLDDIFHYIIIVNTPHLFSKEYMIE